MNKESNSYTLIYSAIIVIIVAVMLAYSAEALQPWQKKNIEIDKIRHILTSVNVASTRSDAKQSFEKYVVDSYLVNSKGDKITGDAFGTELINEFKKPHSERKYPVFEAVIDGNKKYILSMRGSGLYGPIWGYISLNDDKNTVYGASFDHEGETPGLGAEIDKPQFGNGFIGKKFFNQENQFTSIAVVKPGKSARGQDYVDGVSGGTITSQAVDVMLKSSIGTYEAFLRK
jgi:Na+-transporting NADH:ubiquinone oxidoreductase subunit C